MRFEFHLANAAAHNLASARIREQTRMALVCEGLHRLGHDAVIADYSSEFRSSNRWQFFCHLEGRLLDAVQVLPAETLLRSRPGDPTVAFKCSAGWSRDAQILQHCDVALFHEYDVTYEAHRKVLAVPFMVHDCIIEHFINTGLFDAYLADDVGAIREQYRVERDIVAGFLGVGHYGRKDKAAQLPDWCVFEFNDSPKFTPDAYLRWISRCQVGFNMEGETPKSYRFSELTLMGVVNAAPPCATRVTPELTERNSVLMKDWGDSDSVINALSRTNELIAAADECYRGGWSPAGQARQLARMLA